MKIPPETWRDVPVGVLGLGRSGRAAARLLARAGATVYASDIAETEELRGHLGALEELGVEVELGAHDTGRLSQCDLVVLSPGIPSTADVLAAPELRSRPVISELELAFLFLGAPVIAVTGTNGKTTTTAWIGAILEGAGRRIGVGGNIGRALSDLVTDGVEYEWIVAEVSSFQLARIVRFRPAIGVLLNLRPDHLDRYRDLDDYYADKARFFMNADAESRWVLNGEDDAVRAMAAARPGRKRYFRVDTPLQAGEEGGFVSSDGTLTLRRNGDDVPLVPRAEIRLLGVHNVANALAASVASLWAGVEPREIGRALSAFEPLPHRLQPVAEANGVLWINDSKATNVASTRVAIQSMERPTILLLGGRPKGESYAALRDEVPDRVRAVVAFGEAADRIEHDLGDAVRVVSVSGALSDVVRIAGELAGPGDAVLLSPACASFDMFRDYEDRGERFTQLAREAAS